MSSLGQEDVEIISMEVSTCVEHLRLAMLHILCKRKQNFPAMEEICTLRIARTTNS